MSGLYDELGPKGRRQTQIVTAIAVLAFALIIGIVLVRLGRAGQLAPERWAVLLQPDLLNLLLVGLLATIQAALAAAALTLVFGVLLAAGLLSKSRFVPLIVIWIELFRGLPLLLLIFFLYLGGPAVGLQISTFWALIIGITLYNSAVLGEIFKAGVLSLPRGQAEAAQSIGMSSAQVMGIILLPQATRVMLPVLISQFVIVLKETSLGFVVGYSELLRTGRSVVEYLGGQYSIPVYTAIAAIYVVLNILLSMAANRANKQGGRKKSGRCTA